jgi:hypothetical protein
MRYLDFDLEISPGNGRNSPVAVLNSPAGEARATMRFPFTSQQLQDYLDQVQMALAGSGEARRQASQAVQEFGHKLFDALLVGEGPIWPAKIIYNV